MGDTNTANEQVKLISLDNLETYTEYVERKGIDITYEDYQKLTPEEKANKTYYVTDYESGGSADAHDISYDNEDSGLTATDVQEAIDEVCETIGTLPTSDTTYTLEAGTGDDANKIVLTPSSGTAQKITVPYATDAGTVNGKTVAENVPAGAVFTDTTDADDLNYDNTNSGLTATKVQEAIDEVHSSVSDLEDTVDNLTDEVSDDEPYVIRQGKGNMVGLNIVGGSLAWNQLADFTAAQIPSSLYGINYSYTDGKSFKISGTCTSSHDRSGWFGLDSNAIITGHVYLLDTRKISGSASDDSLRVSIDITNSVAIGGSRIVKISESTSDFNRRLFLWFNANSAFTDYVISFNVIDLTLLFGSTIAEYIYSLDQATDGAGVAWFKQYFQNDYYAYNAGSIQSVNVKSRKVVGFNQWDEQWEPGVYSTQTGAKSDNDTTIRSKNKIPVLSNTTYYCSYLGTVASCDVWGLFFDEEGVIISGYATGRSTYQNAHKIQNYEFTTPPNCVSMVFYLAASTPHKAYYYDICINITNSAKNGTYEPYQESEYNFSTQQFRGIPKLVNNKLNYDGDIYTSDGKIIRKYGIVDLGTFTWYKGTQQGNTRFSCKIATGNYGNNVVYSKLICAKYPIDSAPLGENDVNKALCGWAADNALDIYVRDDTYSDTSAIKTAMSGVYLVYELATPTTQSTSPYQNPQRSSTDGIEEFVDYGVSSGNRDVSIPVGHNSTYQLSNILLDIQNYVDGKVNAKVPDVTSPTGVRYLCDDNTWQDALPPIRVGRSGTSGDYSSTYYYTRFGFVTMLWVEGIINRWDYDQVITICSPGFVPMGAIDVVYGVGVYDGDNPPTADNVAHFYMENGDVKIYCEKEMHYGRAFFMFIDTTMS